jgi:exopolyphosphatase/pppGpp-phosphohydrolase
VIDVGGGSTELITHGFRTSLDIGSVRLTERFGIHWGAAAAYIREQLPPLAASRAIGVDGTTAEVAHIAGTRAPTLDDIQGVLDWIATTNEEERRARLLLPDRSEVLAAGVLILRETLRHAKVEGVDASERDILNGAVLHAAELPADDDGGVPPGAFACC